MAQVGVTVKLTVNAKVAAYWASIDRLDLVFHNGEATVQLDEATEYLFYYWIEGAAGGKVDFTLKQGNDVRLKGAGTIPAGYRKVGNAHFFKTN